MANQENKTEKATIIDGVVLTDQVISQLKDYQEDDNEYLKQTCDYLSDAICMLAINMDDVEDKDEATKVMQRLAYIRDNIKRLKKP